jgi:DNA-binding NarL/FixJ family response regulator
MDISLAADSGLELTKEIKGLYPEIVIFILTGYDFPEYRDAAFQYGADFFLVKGAATLRDMVKLIETVLFRESKIGDVVK